MMILKSLFFLGKTIKIKCCESMEDDFYRYAFDIIVDLVRTFHRTQRESGFLEKVLKLKSDSTILDIGCGTGKLSIELARKGYKVVGIDISPYAITQCKSKCKEINIGNVQWINDDLYSYQFNLNFDAAFYIGGSLGSPLDNLNPSGLVGFFKKVFSVLKKKSIFVVDPIVYETIIKRVPFPNSWYRIKNIIVLSNLSFDILNKVLKGSYIVFKDDIVRGYGFDHINIRKILIHLFKLFDVYNTVKRYINIQHYWNIENNIYNLFARMLFFNRTVRLTCHKKNPKKCFIKKFNLYIYTFEELIKIITDIGFKVEAAYGGINLEPFTYSSPELYLVLSKP